MKHKSHSMEAVKQINQGRRVFQIHPSLHCNYTCSHCYSSSSPQHKQFLDIETLINALIDAKKMGYEALSISGGEPMLYPHLKELFIKAQKLGMKTSVITNGSFPEKKYQEYEGLIDTIGVSLDGNERLHNQVRQNPKAFARVNRFLDFSSKYFEQTGVTYSISDQSWEMLPEILDYVDSKKIDLFQAHPLEMFGRTLRQRFSTLSRNNLNKAYILTQTVACQYPFPIQFDALSKEAASTNLIPNITGKNAAACVDLIVLTEDGKVIPYNYGMPPQWVIGDLTHQRLSDGWESFKNNNLGSFHLWSIKSVEKMTHQINTPSEVFIDINQSHYLKI